MNSGGRMPGARHYARIDVHELKLLIERKIGRERSDMYFHLLTRFLSCKLGKAEFDNLCVGLVGRENISLHNKLLLSIARNACSAKTPPEKHSKSETSLNSAMPNGGQKNKLPSLSKDVFPQSPRRGRTPALRDRKGKDRPSPLGPQGKPHEDSSAKVLEQQSATELLSLGSRPPVEVNSVEDGEEVEQAAISPGTHSRSPLTAPLGISLNKRGPKKVLLGPTGSFLPAETCHNTGMLPDFNTLKKRLEQKMEVDGDGFKVSTDFINLLNNGLDAYLKRLIKPCLGVAGPKSVKRHPNQVQPQGVYVQNGMGAMRYSRNPNGLFSVSPLDFRVAMELNPSVLGEEWPVQMEKLSLQLFAPE